MYEILMKGDTSNDIVLDSGDIIFVPPYENYIEVSGEIKRPGIYELLENETLDDAIGFSGGLKGSAYSKLLKSLEQIKKAVQKFLM